MESIESLLKNYTSVKESKELINFGMDPNSADSIWLLDDTDILVHIPYKDYNNKLGLAIPAWSVSSLMSILNNHCDIVETIYKNGKFIIERAVPSKTNNPIVYGGTFDSIKKSYIKMILTFLKSNLFDNICEGDTILSDWLHDDKLIVDSELIVNRTGKFNVYCHYPEKQFETHEVPYSSIKKVIKKGSTFNF